MVISRVLMFKEGANADHKLNVVYQSDLLWRDTNMCLKHGANRFVNCAESLSAYRVQRHTSSQILHVKVGILYCTEKLGVLKGIKFEVLDVCWDESFEIIKVVINCVTRLYQRKLNACDLKTSCGPNNSRKFGFEGFSWAMFENWYLSFGPYWLKIYVSRSHQTWGARGVLRWIFWKNQSSYSLCNALISKNIECFGN